MVEAKTAETRESLGTTSTDALPVGVSCVPESEPAKPRRGRPKGTPNKVNRIAKEAIAEAEPHSFLIKVMLGRQFKRAGTEGAKRRVACYPTLGESITAAETLLRKIAPDMKATEISGPEGGPIRTEDATRLGMVELGRRAAFLLDLVGRDAGEAGQEGHSETTGAPPFSTPRAPVPHSGHTPPENSEKNSARNPDEARSPDSRFGVTAPDGSCLFPSVPPALDTPEAEEAPQAALEPDREPNVGEVATVGGYAIHCKENSRDNLPDLFEIFDDHGRQIRYPINGFQNALKKIRELAGDVDMTVTITAQRPAFSQSRPDQRAERTVSAPVVHGSYAHRKGN